MIEPGTVIKSIGDGSTCDNLPATICVLGTLHAVGTSSQPIIFTSSNDPVGGNTGSGNPQPGDWAGITVSRNSGSAYPPASVDLENATVEYSGGFGSGAGINLDAPNPTLTDDTVENVPGVAYDLNLEGPFNNVSGVMASKDGTPVLDLSGGSLTTTTLPAEPIPWFTSSGVLVLGGQTLTIEPGTVIKSLGGGPNSTWCDNLPANICVLGTLHAVGTSSQPIIFTSSNDPVGGNTGSGNPQPGDWAGITVSRNSGSAYPPASVDLENATVEYSGGFGSGAGINLDAPNPTLTDDTVENVPGVAYDLNSEGPFNNVSGVMASKDGTPVLDLSGGSLTTTTLPAEPIPWFTSSGVLVLGGQTLTIEPGTVIKSLGGGPNSTWCDNLPANICVLGTLHAVGTSSQPIIFTSSNDPVGGNTGSGNPQPGDWAGITVSRNSGSAYPPASVDLENATVEYSGGFGSGAGINLDAPNPTLTDDTVENVPGVAYDLNSEGPFNNVSGVMASKDGTPVLDLEGGSLNTTTLPAEPIPWDTSGGVSVDSGQTLTIEPGAVIKSFGDGQSCDGVAANLCVSGTLQAVGTLGKPVVFTSMNDTSDPAGLNTGNGSPAPGDWAGISVGNINASVLFNYDVIEYADTAIGIGQLGTGVQVDNSEFLNNNAAISVNSTPVVSEVLSGILSLLPCGPPFTSFVTGTGDWFGSTGSPGGVIDLGSIVGDLVPPPIAHLIATMDALLPAAPGGYNTIPWSLWTCSEIPITYVTPVLVTLASGAPFPQFNETFGPKAANHPASFGEGDLLHSARSGGPQRLFEGRGRRVSTAHVVRH